MWADTGPGLGGLVDAKAKYAPTLPTTGYDRQQQPLRVLRATVLTAYQSLGVYDVGTDIGRYLVSYHGVRRGPLGAKELGGFSSGAQVWVAVDPGSGARYGTIISGCDSPAPAIDGQSRAYLAWPQAAGPQFESKNGRYEASRLPDKMYTDLPFGVFKNDSPVRDAVDGDWGVFNLFGGGHFVEAFRAGVRGGAFSGIEFEADDNTARLYAEALEVKTYGREDEERRLGPALFTFGRKVYWPVDSLADNRPQELIVDSPAVGGYNRIFSYRIKDNLPSGSTNAVAEATGQLALLWEHRGLDGSYRLTSASSITLAKHFGHQVPIELIEKQNNTAIVSEYPGVLSRTDATENEARYQKPTQTVPNRAYPSTSTILDRILNPLVKGADITADTNASAAPVANSLLRTIFAWQCSGGFSELSEQWSFKEYPKYLASFSDWRDKPSIKDAVDNYISVSPSAWRHPRSVVINCGPYGSPKRVYLGSAYISILDDGGIAIQAASGEQLLMTGGSIQMSAPHDVITHAGRNALEVVGQDKSVHVNRHYDATAGGAASLIVNQRLQIAGGMSGSGQTLIYGGGNSTAQATGETNDGGGVVLASPWTVYAKSTRVVLSGRGAGWSSQGTPDGITGGGVYLDSDQAIACTTGDQNDTVSIGHTIEATNSYGGFSIGRTAEFQRVMTKHIGFTTSGSWQGLALTNKQAVRGYQFSPRLAIADLARVDIYPARMSSNAYGFKHVGEANLYFTAIIGQWRELQRSFLTSLGVNAVPPTDYSGQHPIAVFGLSTDSAVVSAVYTVNGEVGISANSVTGNVVYLPQGI